MFSSLKTSFEQSNMKSIITKRGSNEASIDDFQAIFNSIALNVFTKTSLPNNVYNMFQKKL